MATNLVDAKITVPNQTSKTIGELFDRAFAVTFDQTPPAAGIFDATEASDMAVFAYYDPAWTPATFSNKVLWFKADAGVYKDAGSTVASDGDTVQQWNDQSGNNDHISQATAGNRPTFDIDGANGHPAVVLNPAGATTWLISTANAVALNSTTVTIFIVFYPAAFDTSFGGRIISLLANGAGNDYTNPSLSISFRYPDTKVETYSSGDLGNGGQKLPVALNTVQVYGLVLDGSLAKTYLDGVLQGTATSFTSTIGAAGGVTFGLGNDAAANSPPGRVRIAEVFVKTGAVTATELFQYTAYAKVKYSIPWL